MTGDQLGTFMYVPRKPDEIQTVAVTRRGLASMTGLALLVLLFISLVSFVLNVFLPDPGDKRSD